MQLAVLDFIWAQDLVLPLGWINDNGHGYLLENKRWPSGHVQAPPGGKVIANIFESIARKPGRISLKI